eukprot:gene6023-10025_t
MNEDLETPQDDEDLKKKYSNPNKKRKYFLILIILIILATIGYFIPFKKIEEIKVDKNFVPKFKLPSYFKRYMKTNKLRDLYEDYSIFHERSITSFKDCKDLEDRKVLIFKPFVSAGLGNNLVGLTSSFLVALLTERVFLVNWQGQWGCGAPLVELFKNPNEKFKWSYPEFMATHTGCHRQNDLNLEITHREKESDYSNGLFKCKNIQVEIDNYGGWIEISSNQYFIPYLIENENYSKFLRRMFPKLNVFSEISKFLYHPVDVIQQRIDHFLNQNSEKKNLIGIQIRHNEKENQIIWPKGEHEKYFWKCAQENLIPKLKKDDFKIFIVSDNSTTKHHAKQYFGEENVIFIDNVYRNSGWYLNGRDSESVKDALVEMFAFTKCKEFIVSQWSTFGNVGHGIASKSPWLIELRGTSATCHKLISPEPQFHWKWRGNRINCNYWNGGKNKPPLRK